MLEKDKPSTVHVLCMLYVPPKAVDLWVHGEVCGFSNYCI